VNITNILQAIVDKTVAHFASNNYTNAQSHPRVALYRNTLKKVANVSSKKYPQSNESLLKRVLKEKKAGRPISPVVDFYNSISIEHAVSAGAFDLPELRAVDAPSLVPRTNLFLWMPPPMRSQKMWTRGRSCMLKETLF
jgi:DNA/RNA-binding domain of Phe-tRNA-synthetase-like protein